MPVDRKKYELLHKVRLAHICAPTTYRHIVSFNAHGTIALRHIAVCVPVCVCVLLSFFLVSQRTEECLFAKAVRLLLFAVFVYKRKNGFECTEKVSSSQCCRCGGAESCVCSPFG